MSELILKEKNGKVVMCKGSFESSGMTHWTMQELAHYFVECGYFTRVINGDTNEVIAEKNISSLEKGQGIIGILAVIVMLLLIVAALAFFLWMIFDARGFSEGLNNAGNAWDLIMYWINRINNLV